jgi:hypothetical protein
VSLAPPKRNPQISNGRPSRFPMVRLFAAKNRDAVRNWKTRKGVKVKRRHHEAQVT